jgi:hypothetical protein
MDRPFRGRSLTETNLTKQCCDEDERLDREAGGGETGLKRSDPGTRNLEPRTGAANGIRG